MEEDMAITEMWRFRTRRASKQKARRKRNRELAYVNSRPKRNSELACGFDLETDSYQNIVWCNSRHCYTMELFAKLGFHCYNFEKGTNFKFLCWEKQCSATLDFQAPVLIYGGSMPPDSDVGNKLVDENWDDDKVIDEFYTCEMPNWLSDEALASDNKKNYMVQELELHENDWLHLYLELAFFFKLKCHMGDSPLLEINKVVIENKEDYITEPSEKLKAENAIFYISYKYKGASQSSLDGDHKAIVRKTMDGKPEHMSLEITNVDETSDIHKAMHTLNLDRKA